jgi:hypothetical protein
MSFASATARLSTQLMHRIAPQHRGNNTVRAFAHGSKSGISRRPLLIGKGWYVILGLALFGLALFSTSISRAKHRVTTAMCTVCHVMWL